MTLGASLGTQMVTANVRSTFTSTTLTLATVLPARLASGSDCIVNWVAIPKTDLVTAASCGSSGGMSLGGFSRSNLRCSTDGEARLILTPSAATAAAILNNTAIVSTLHLIRSSLPE